MVKVDIILDILLVYFGLPAITCSVFNIITGRGMIFNITILILILPGFILSSIRIMKRLIK